MENDCIFCTKENVAVLWENENFYIIENIKPVEFGHLLIIPKNHIDEISSLSKEQFVQLYDIILSIINLFENVEYACFNLVKDDKRRFIKGHAHQHFHPISDETIVYKPSNERPLISEYEKGKLLAMFDGFTVDYSDLVFFSDDTVDQQKKRFIKK